MNKKLWSFALLPLVTAFSGAAALGTSQTLQAGQFKVKVTAPPTTKRQAFYPITVTYTNQGKAPVRFNDPFDCALLWNVQDGTTGHIIPKPAKQPNYACPANIAPLKTLGPGKSYSGTMSAIIAMYPKGLYLISAENLQRLRPILYLPSNKSQTTVFTPAIHEIRFEIR